MRNDRFWFIIKFSTSEALLSMTKSFWKDIDNKKTIYPFLLNLSKNIWFYFSFDALTKTEEDWI